MIVLYYADSDSSGNITGFYNDEVWEVTKIPTTAIEITEEKWLDAVANQGKYIVTAGALVLAPAPTAALQLASAQAEKIDEIKAAQSNAIATFKSLALGTEHTYLAGILDMAYLNGEYSFVKGDDYDNKPIPWYTVESGFVDHTKAQFIQVYLDGRTNVQTASNHRSTLEMQINAATDITQVNSIVW